MRARRLARVTVACDAQTWRILRRDAALDPAETELAILEMIDPVLRHRAPCPGAHRFCGSPGTSHLPGLPSLTRVEQGRCGPNDESLP